MVIQAVGRALNGTGIAPVEVVEFACGQVGVLNTQLWQGFQTLAGPDAHPLDGYPPRVGPVHRWMSLSEVEAVIAGQPEEHVVIFDGHGGKQVARFGPAGTRAAGVDPRGKTLLDPMLKVRRGTARSWVLTHNHPACGVLSSLDLVLAARLDLAEIRAVCADGTLWWCPRPEADWPSEAEMQSLCEASERLALPMTEEAFDEKVRLRRRFDRLEEAWSAFFSSYFTAVFNQKARQRGFTGLSIQLQASADRRGSAHRRSGLAAPAQVAGG